MERLLQVDPLTSINLSMSGMVAMFDGRYDDALRWTQRSVDIDPENPSHRMMHALMLAANHRAEEASGLLEGVARDTPQMAWAQLATAMAAALRDDREGVIRVFTPELRSSASAKRRSMASSAPSTSGSSTIPSSPSTNPFSQAYAASRDTSASWSAYGGSGSSSRPRHRARKRARSRCVVA